MTISKTREEMFAEREKYELDDDKLLSYAVGLMPESIKNAKYSREGKLNSYGVGFKSALLFLEDVLEYRKKYNIDISDIPYEVRIYDPMLWVIAIRWARERRQGLCDVFRLMWSDICNPNTEIEEKKILVRDFADKIHYYTGEYSNVCEFIEEIQQKLAGS
jgi:hypothetical protein